MLKQFHMFRANDIPLLFCYPEVPSLLFVILRCERLFKCICCLYICLNITPSCFERRGFNKPFLPLGGLSKENASLWVSSFLRCMQCFYYKD